MEEKAENRFAHYFRTSLEMAAESCSLALEDILAGHLEEGRIDTRTLKDVTAALKDLNGLGGSDMPDREITVRFSSETLSCGV